MVLKHIIWVYTEWSTLSDECLLVLRGRAAIRQINDCVEMRVLTGCDPHSNLLPTILDAALPMWRERARALHRQRRHRWAIEKHTGMSGCRDYILRWERDQEFLDTPIAGGIHISMRGKVSGFNLWLGDLWPLFEEIYNEGNILNLVPEPQGSDTLVIRQKDGSWSGQIRAVDPELRYRDLRWHEVEEECTNASTD